MSEQGLEVLDSSYQKTQEWIGSLAARAHLEKGDAYKAMRAVLLTLRDRLPMQEAVHLGAQLPMILRGLYYEGWKPSQTPQKLSRDEFLQAVEEKIVTKGVVDPVRMTRDVLYVLGSYVSPGEFDNVKRILPKELQTFWPASDEPGAYRATPTGKQNAAPRRNVKAATAAKRKRTVGGLPKQTRTAQGGKAATKKKH